MNNARRCGILVDNDMAKNKNHFQRRAAYCAATALIVGGLLGIPKNMRAEGEGATTDADVSDLQIQINDKQSKIQELERQQNLYEQTITQKQQEELNLQNQIDVLDAQIADTGTDIEKLELQIQSLGLQVQEIETQISAKEKDIEKQKGQLAQLLRLLNRYDRKTLLEISLANDTLSKFFNQMKYLQTIESQSKKTLDTVKGLREQLQQQQEKKQEAKQSSEAKKQQKENEKSGLASQQDYREKLLDETQNTEEKFSKLLSQAKQEQDAANADVQLLEQQVRERLQGKQEVLLTPSQLIWPIDSRTITSYFHDPNYVFRKLFEHPAIDIATPQGTPLKAAASGIVVRAKNAGYGYSYIAVAHGNDLMTVYGHVSKISVVENDFVAQGQIIGYSGGTPGTPGAGRLTTGAHLHFEVRSGGIPQNPLNYLQ